MLTIRNLQAGYHDHIVVNLPDLTLQSGQTCLIKGLSGSGKTTLLQTLAGLLRPLKGCVLLGGQDLHQMTESQRDRVRGASIGIVFQTLHLIKSLSVIENILLGAYLSGQVQDLDLAHTLMEKLGIADLKTRQATDISQGQAQRVAIARALMTSPSLLLADEPTSSLDDHACAQTLTLLRSLCQDSGTILIISSHDNRIRDSFDQTIHLGATA